MIENHWGSGKMDLVSLAPTMENDHEFMDWLASYFRSGASPSAALVLTKMNTQVDIIDILDTIEVPTLLLYRKDDIDVKVEEGRFIHDRIRGSRFIQFPGQDHLFWAGDAQAVLNEMIAFIFEDHDHQGYDRVLATILKIKVSGTSNHKAIYGSAAGDDIQVKIESILSKKIRQFRGTMLQTNPSKDMATFDGPSKAVHCAIEIRDAIQRIGLVTYQGIHIGECILSVQNELGGSAVNVAAQLLEKALPNEIIITHTVNNLLSGTGLEFKPHGHLRTVENKTMQTLSLDDGSESKEVENPDEDIATHYSGVINRNHSILENVLQSIENHLDDEQYSVQDLCTEVGLSIRQLQRKLKSITNKSPSQLVRSVRLHKAKELIVHQNKSVSEATYMTGFSSISYFTKCFKKEFGESPSSLE